MQNGLSQFMFQNPAALLLLAGVPAIAFLFNYAQRRRLAARKRFFREDARRDFGRRNCLYQAAALCGAYLFIVLALARPGWNPRPQERLRRGRDVVFVLDVSRSMLAEDVAPNRLERAKSAIADCLEGMAGDRVGLVAFAGEAEVQCPLTVDYDCFRKILRDCGPRSIPRGGSMLGAGMDVAAVKLLAGSKPGYQDVILIGDGEDHGSDMDAAVAKLDDAGARLIVLGIGDPEKGSPIPLDDGQQEAYLQYQGRNVLTRLHSDRLRRLVESSAKGVYFDVGTGRIALGRIYRQLIARAERDMIAAQGLLVYDEGYQVFIAIALLLLGISAWPLNKIRRPAAILALAAVLLHLPSPARADSVRNSFERGVELYSNGNHSEALEAFQKGVDKRPGSFPLRYNLGVAQYALGDYSHAEESFARALPEAEAIQTRSRALYNLGNSLYRQAETLLGEDPAKAGQTLARSAACYRQVLDMDPDSMDAAYNLEIANTLAAVAAELQNSEKSDEQQDSDEDSEQEGEEGKKKPKPSDQFKKADADTQDGKCYLMPTENPEDILEEERRNNEERLKRIEQQVEDVEKDW